MVKIFDFICWVFWKIGDGWDWLVAEGAARWQTLGMNADQIIALIKEQIKDLPQDRAMLVMQELCETLEVSRKQTVPPAAPGTCDTSNLAAARKEKE
jgi:hypothetical protein